MKIVAPAGDFNRMKIAINSGADEIYLGLKGFGARRNANNLTLEELKDAIDFAHIRGAKIFLTLNTIMTDYEIDYLYENVKKLYEHGLDAVIVQDLGYAYFLHKNFPNLEIHGSTQMALFFSEEINFLKKYGFTRVVLPRELSIDEIKNIRKNTDMELEVFVSGAMCVCVSGQCYFSSFIGGRSGNRGLCAQPCRKEYSNSKNNKGFLLSPKDQLMTFDEIEFLKNIGVDSIKIEGRMKDESYVQQTVEYYKNLINGLRVEENISKIFNRGYSKGYFYGRNNNLINSKYSKHIGYKIGIIKNKELLLEKSLSVGDGVVFLDKDYNVLEGRYINSITLSSNKKSNNIAQKGDVILIETPKNTKYVYKNYDFKLNKEISKNIKNSSKKIPVSIFVEAKVNETMKIIFKYTKNSDGIIDFFCETDFVLQESLNKKIEKKIIYEKVSEIGDSTFYPERIDINIDENVFIPLSELKKIKRMCIDGLTNRIITSYRRNDNLNFVSILNSNKNSISKPPKLLALYNNDEQYKVLKENMQNFNLDLLISKNSNSFQDSNILLASSLAQVLNTNKGVLLNWNLNIFNSYSFELLSKINNIFGVIISPELSFEKISKINANKLKKCVLIYSKIKAMTINNSISENENDIFINNEKDKFIISKHLDVTEIFFEKPLNIINDIDSLNYLMADYYVLDFSDESSEEIFKILSQLKTKRGDYRPYNYKKGVF